MPSGIRTWKKPSPLIATSSGLSVLLQVALRWMRSVATTRTPVPTCRPDGRRVCSRGLAADLAQVLVHQVLEHGAAALEAVGADVGQVVRDDVQLGLLGFQAGLGDLEGTHHGECSFGMGGSAVGQQLVGRLLVVVRGLHRLHLHLEAARAARSWRPWPRPALTLLPSTAPPATRHGRVGFGRRQAFAHAEQAVVAAHQVGGRRVDQLQAADLGHAGWRIARAARRDGAVGRDRARVEPGGTTSAPPSPTTGRPPMVSSWPSAPTCRSPTRV